MNFDCPKINQEFTENNNENKNAKKILHLECYMLYISILHTKLSILVFILFLNFLT